MISLPKISSGLISCVLGMLKIAWLTPKPASSLHRAITLCRRLGVDAYGVPARCDGCRRVTIWYNTLRDVAAAPKAAWEAFRHRPAAVQSPPDPALRRAVEQHHP